MEIESEMNACCYKVCCCDGDLDYYFFWACPTIYELCASCFPRVVLPSSQEPASG